MVDALVETALSAAAFFGWLAVGLLSVVSAASGIRSLWRRSSPLSEDLVELVGWIVLLLAGLAAVGFAGALLCGGVA